ncbi:uncharacterized protein UV8b_03091 [Ustilaginoidea virens]|uniref:Uncharacterized protein n=1 Tax=Ustilaginoidea virens TaxID=1159556 RepID=A0A063C5V4_USTVR|nr:uncharacterized protein UV8b_03091 [Ustilaginoidea virens]QUC18850.1 hypothetical protein UV8b_03091 [Ustilaginoidea virens]GAO15789.1 hypothetical protein UVI_02021450 [Ustilaginoidea virens]
MTTLQNQFKSSLQTANNNVTITQETYLPALALIIHYFNAGNTPSELAQIRTQAQTWCKSYFKTDTPPCHAPPELVAAHPHLFDLGIPSWQRLQHRAAFAQETDADGDQTLPFPDCLEPTLLEDYEIYEMVNRLHNEQAVHGQQADDYGRWRVPVTAADVGYTPLVFYIPDIMVHLARLAPGDGMDKAVLERRLRDVDVQMGGVENGDGLDEDGDDSSVMAIDTDVGNGEDVVMTRWVL